MPRITLNVKTKKNTTLPLSAQELKNTFLFGIDIKLNNQSIPDDVIEFHIQAAKEHVEHYLNWKFDLQLYTENKDFHYDDWVSWGQVKTTYPIVCPISLQGFIGTTRQVNYPKEWLTARKSSDNQIYSRLLHVVPNANSTYHQAAALYTGLFPNRASIGGSSNTPEYWTVTYITGFKKIPSDILQAIGMLAAINVLTVGNETMAQAMGNLGVSSKSISIDGLSQSTSMYINGQAGVFGARIKQYTDSLLGVGGQDGILNKLRDFYGAIVWTTC